MLLFFVSILYIDDIKKKKKKKKVEEGERKEKKKQKKKKRMNEPENYRAFNRLVICVKPTTQFRDIDQKYNFEKLRDECRPYKSISSALSFLIIFYSV